MKESSFNINDNNLDITYIGDREIENYARTHPGLHISSDIRLLLDMGFDKKTINKTYILLRPPNIQRAIDYLTDVNGIMQHNFFENKTGTNKKLCYICKKPRKEHLGYVEGIYTEDNDNINNNNFIDMNISEKATCKVCYEVMTEKEMKFNSLPCGHL